MTNDQTLFYYSKHNKQPLAYTKTHDAAYRYLGYRDVPKIIKKYIQGGTALDYGCGAGYSTQFLNELGFNAAGVDINKGMIQQAQLEYPDLTFLYIKNEAVPFDDATFNLILSSFVLLEISSKKEMIAYLSEAKRVMKKSSSFFVGITGSEELHKISRKWLDFGTDFPENKNLASGKLVKLYHYNSHIEFADYYWKQTDYQNLFTKAGFDIIEVRSPLGNKQENYAWKDELVASPFTILVSKLK